MAKAHPHLKAHVPPTESHHSLDRRILCTSPRLFRSGAVFSETEKIEAAGKGPVIALVNEMHIQKTSRA